MSHLNSGREIKCVNKGDNDYTVKNLSLKNNDCLFFFFCWRTVNKGLFSFFLPFFPRLPVLRAAPTSWPEA